MPEYPDILPSPRLLYSDSSMPTTIATKILEGQRFQRNRFNEIHEGIPVEFSFSDEQMGIFRAWYHYKLFNGVASFELDLELGGGIQTYTVKFSQCSYSVNRVSHNRSTLKTTIYIEDTPVMDEASVDAIIAANPNP